MHKPLLSVVTITKNDPKGLFRTISSIPSHLASELQYVIVDGDPHNTLYYTPELKSKIDVLVMEEDHGISDAFNKGISNSVGDYILMINSGDELLTGSNIVEINEILKHDFDIFAFGVMSAATGRKVPSRGTDAGQIPHQGLCVRRAIYDSLGGYLPSFKLRMDYEFILRAKCASVSFNFPGVPLTKYAHGGLSTIRSNRIRFYQEGLSAELLHLGLPRMRTLSRYFYWRARKQFQ